MLYGKVGFRWRLAVLRVEGAFKFVAEALDGQLEPSFFIMVDIETR